MSEWKCNFCDDHLYDKLDYIIHILEHHVKIDGLGVAT